MASKATEKRYDGIGNVNDVVVTAQRCPATGVVANFWHTKDAEKVAGLIRDLAPLGRTERWKETVERWALMVEDAGDDPKRFEWAFFQGGIYAGYAAE